MYYVSLIIGILRGGAPAWLGSEGKVSACNIISHIVLLHGLVPHYADSIIGVEWYLGALVIFWGIAPFLYKCVKNVESGFIAFLASLFFVNLWNKMEVFMPEYDQQIYHWWFMSISVFAQFHVLLLGVLLYTIVSKTKMIDDMRGNKTLSLCVLITSMIIILGEIMGVNNLALFNVYIRYGIAFAGIFISQEMYSFRIVDNVIFQRVGKMSLPMYLFHIYIKELFSRIIHFESVIITNMVIFTGTIIVTFFLSMIIIRYLDAPIKMWISRRKVCFPNVRY